MLLTFVPKNGRVPLVAGVFGSMVLLNRTEQDESINKATRERPARVYGNAVSGSHVDSDDSHEPDEATVSEFFLVK